MKRFVLLGSCMTALLLLVLLASPATAQSAKGKRASRPQTDYVTIASAGPLTEIFLGVDVSAQIAYAGDTDYQVYPSDTIPGDYGTFLVVNDTLFAPDFDAHGGTATSGLGVYTPFTPVSQSAVAGTGSAADPYRVTTVVDVGNTGLRVTQVDSYVVGDEAYHTVISVANSGNAAIDAILYRAMDCYLGGSDSGYGLADPATGAVACTKTPNNAPPDRIEQLLPLTEGNRYYQAGYSEVWAAIGSHQPFNNSCRCDEDIDNGIGISWSTTIPAGGTVSYAHLTTFSPLGRLPLTTTKVAQSPTSAPGGVNGYTITLSNPNPDSVTVDFIQDTLPTGFSYVAGSSSGATTANPTVSGQSLSWAGPFIVPAEGTLSLSFQVTVSGTPGTYYNQATAGATGYTVAPTGATAPIVVQATTSVTVSTLGQAAKSPLRLWLALGLLAAVGTLYVVRRHR